MKKATDLEQETWVMPVPCYIAEISIFWQDAVETTPSPARGLLKHDVYSLHWVTTALAVETLLILSGIFMKFSGYIPVAVLR